MSVPPRESSMPRNTASNMMMGPHMGGLRSTSPPRYSPHNDMMRSLSPGRGIHPHDNPYTARSSYHPHLTNNYMGGADMTMSGPGSLMGTRSLREPMMTSSRSFSPSGPRSFGPSPSFDGMNAMRSSMNRYDMMPQSSVRSAMPGSASRFYPQSSDSPMARSVRSGLPSPVFPPSSF